MAIVNKFGGNVQVAGNVISYQVAAVPVVGAYPVQVGIASTTQLAAGSPQYIVVNTTAGAATFTLPTAGSDTDGEAFTIRNEGAAAAVTVTTFGTLANDVWASYACQNSGTAYSWVLTATNA